LQVPIEHDTSFELFLGWFREPRQRCCCLP